MRSQNHDMNDTTAQQLAQAIQALATTAAAPKQVHQPFQPRFVASIR